MNSLFTKIAGLLGGKPTELTDDETAALFTKLADPAAPPAPVVTPEPKPEVPAPATADFTKAPEFVALQAKSAADAAKIAEFSAKLLVADAEKWVAGELAANRAVVTEQADLVALFVQASARFEGIG